MKMGKWILYKKRSDIVLTLQSRSTKELHIG